MKRFIMKSKKWGTVVVTVDDEDADLLRKQVWTASGTKTPQVAKTISGKVTCLSHVIAGAKAGEWVRHLNGMPLDFRRANLAIDIMVRKAA